MGKEGYALGLREGLKRPRAVGWQRALGGGLDLGWVSGMNTAGSRGKLEVMQHKMRGGRDQGTLPR